MANVCTHSKPYGPHSLILPTLTSMVVTNKGIYIHIYIYFIHIFVLPRDILAVVIV